MIQAPKGTRDVLPNEGYKWQFLEALLKEAADEFGFREIRFPTFEATELFDRGIGDTTDVVQKEMYTFLDNGGRSISLRPEGTASVARAVIEHALDKAGLPVKCYYIAPNFRYEKPQAGRLREHHQFGVETIGSAEPAAEAEVIALADTFLRRLGIDDIVVNLNSVGCPECRKGYNAALRAYFKRQETDLCETCRGRLERNPMRILDCKSPVCQAIAKDAPRVIDYLCAGCAAHFEALKGLLTAMGIPYAVDPGIVRGLDYYTRTVFEFVSGQLGAQSTVCGGGRYDGLIQSIGGAEVPACGFGCGIERLLMITEASGRLPDEPAGPDIFLAAASDDCFPRAIALLHGLRKAGLRAEMDVMRRSLKAQMKYADRLCARFCCVIGGDEVASGRGTFKNMTGGEGFACELSVGAITAAFTENNK